MTQPTPGDWEYSEGRLQAWQEVKGLPRKVPIARLASLEGEAEMDANGRLLAAAPGLLRAAEELLEDDGGAQWRELFREVAKATGEQP